MPSIARIARLTVLPATVFLAVGPSSAAGQLRSPNPLPYAQSQLPGAAPQLLPVGYESDGFASAKPLAAEPQPPAAAPQPPAARQFATSAPVPLSPPSSRPALPRLSAQGESSASGRGELPSMVTVAGSLAVVLGIFFLVAWGMRRATPAGSTHLPGEVLEVLGRASLAQRQQVSLVRCGKKLLLISTTPTGAETLTEITDPLEVDRLAGMCRQGHPGSTTTAFRQVFGQMANSRSERVNG
jgi:flagellar biogenesis protein FliO